MCRAACRRGRIDNGDGDGGDGGDGGHKVIQQQRAGCGGGNGGDGGQWGGGDGGSVMEIVGGRVGGTPWKFPSCGVRAWRVTFRGGRWAVNVGRSGGGGADSRRARSADVPLYKEPNTNTGLSFHSHPSARVTRVLIRRST